MEAKFLPVFDDLMSTMVDSDCNPMGYGREKGLHLSDITKWLRIRRGKTVGGIPGEQDGLRMYSGFMWERALELGFKALQICRLGVARQLKVALDGIHCSPDGLDTSVTPFVLEEYKLTWRSIGQVNKLVAAGVPLGEALSEHYWEWVEVQIPAYLCALRANTGMELTEARLYVFFVNGDYSHKPGRGPQIVVVSLRYTPEELASTWEMILSAKRGMELEAAQREAQ